MTETSKTNGEKPAVLLLGNYRPTVVLARRLQERGFTVIAGLEGCGRVAEVSWYIDELWDHPSLAESPQRFLGDLDVLLSERPDISCVFPVAEEFVRLFAERQTQLPPSVQLASVSADLVKTCLDKRAMMELCRDYGVPTAPFAYVRTLDALFQEAMAIGFPLVIRPERSTDRLGDLKALTVASIEELKVIFNTWPQTRNSPQPGLIIQKKAEGQRHNIYFTARSGALDGVLHSVIARTDRPDGSGLAVDGQIVRADRVLVDHVARFVERLSYDGVGCAQFLVDDVTGAICFLEINPRVTGSHAVPDHCGLDIEAVLMKMAESAGHEGAVPVDRGQAGLRYAWLAGDLEGLKVSLRRGDLSVGAALSWLGNAARTVWRSDMDMMLNWRDPLPGVATLLDILPGIGHLTRSRRLWRVLVRKPTIGCGDSAVESSLEPVTHEA
ncbi:MAG: hypothetical protein ACFB01_17260 [Cohaesibacteraceae bacterium]